jgi:hypothetical protein
MMPGHRPWAHHLRLGWPNKRQGRVRAWVVSLVAAERICFDHRTRIGAAKQPSTSAGYTQRDLDHHDLPTPPTSPAHKPQIHVLCASNVDYRLQFGKWPTRKQWWTLKPDEASSSALTKPSAIEPLQTVIRPQNQHGSKANVPHINTST